MKEIWKDVKGYEGLYQVSNLGNVMSWVNNSQHKRTRGLILKPRISKHGYYYINIYKDGKRKTVKNHRLVATHFISNPKNLPCVNHKDGNKLNNKVSNLEWVTYSENRNHAINTGLVDINNSSLFKSGENNIMFGAKSPRRRRIVQLDLDGNFIREWDCIADAQTTYNTAHISAVCRGERHHDKGFIWRYTEDFILRNKTRKENKKKEERGVKRNMKKQDRIPLIMKELRQFWEQHPNWRLGQVISNLSYEIIGDNDPFHLDDIKLVETLKIKNGKEKICKNCGKPFVCIERADQHYCNRPSPQNSNKTCAEIGPELIYQERYHDDNDWYSWYRKTYQLVQNRVRRNPEKYKSQLFENFKISTKQWIKDIKSGKKTDLEFINWLKQYRAMLNVESNKDKTIAYEDKIIKELTEKDLET